MHKSKYYNKTKLDFLGKGPIYRSLFDNGSVYLFHHASGFAGAKVSLNILAGSMFETTSQHGVAHILEHLIFKEIKTNLIQEMELIGAEVNAYTYKESMCFEMSCLASKLDLLLTKFLDIFLELEFSDEQFEKEKKVVIQELKEDMDDFETQGMEYLFQKNFGNALGHPIGGSVAHIKKFSIVDIKRFYRKYFRPERIILTVVSGEDKFCFSDRFNHIMHRRFGVSKQKPFRLKASNRVSKLNHIVSKQKKKMESAILLFSFNGPSLNATSYYDYLALDELLFEGMSSLLFKKLREEDALVYGLGSSINSFGASGSYIMIFNTQNKHISKIKSSIKEVFSAVIKDGVCPKKIENIKTRLLDAWELMFDSLDERVDFLIDDEVYLLDSMRMIDVKQKIEQVSLKNIQNILKNIYLKNDYSQLHLLQHRG
ncbi:MAG: insulinase family protein [Halobacteriovoraceae bacterium]|jgi:predicted Zn-dependent peptidase|nr:insulinase family protein [Halobacteriovoraceae bacterium]